MSKNLSSVNIDKLLKDFDENGLYPNAMAAAGSVYPKIESGFTFTENSIDELSKTFNNLRYTKCSALLTTIYYNPDAILLQHAPVKKK